MEPKLGEHKFAQAIVDGDWVHVASEGSKSKGKLWIDDLIKLPTVWAALKKLITELRIQ